MSAWLSQSVVELLATPTSTMANHLAGAAQLRNFGGTRSTYNSWVAALNVIKDAVATPIAQTWTVLFEYELHRVGKRADVVLLTDRAIIVIEFKTGVSGDRPGAMRQAEDYALDLFDFHDGCRGHPIIPLAVTATQSSTPLNPLLLWHGVVATHHASPEALGWVLMQINAAIGSPRTPLNAQDWLEAPYRPIPHIVEAARMAFARQAVPAINATRADGGALQRTTAAILREIAAARDHQDHRVVFVTGIPGAGKTRCGLAVAFETDARVRAVYLTGNPSLVHVFREALARDAIDQNTPARLARQSMEQRIQTLPHFRDHHVAVAHAPDEHVIIIDEAQRSWNRAHAIRKTRDRLRPPPLTDSEPGHILDAMARHPDWAVIVALIGSGQEIHDGEGGLAEWGEAIRERAPRWSITAATQVSESTDPRQRLPNGQIGRTVDALHLDVAVRQLGGQQAAAWVDAVLRNDRHRAQAEAAKAHLPFLLTRDLDAMRRALRNRSRGLRRAGLVASSGAKRLRAEGLGVELPHMEAGAVARWFLDHWPKDVRASDSLEVVATEFSCQGLELDFVGMAWGGDLVREGRGEWRVRAFVGTKWQYPSKPEAISNQVNTYRVLLTRARYETIIYVPRGDAGDLTRPPAEFDAIADFLLACGARPLEAMPAPSPAVAEPRLL